MAEEPTPSRYQTRAFAVLLIGAAILFLWTLSPLWVPVFLGLILAVVATPLQARLERRFHHPRILAAGITTLALVVGCGLIGLIGFVVVREILRALPQAPEWVGSGIAWLRTPKVARLLAALGTSPSSTAAAILQKATGAATHLTELLGGVLAVTSSGFLALIFTALTSYYVLVEGELLRSLVVRLVPLPATQTRTLMREFYRAAVGTVLGVAVIALLQGSLATLGFHLFGVERPLVWGALTAVASLLPVFGTALVCLPIALFLSMSHHMGAAIGLFLWWAVLVIGICDYVVRPRLMEGRMRLHSLLVLIAVFGGLEAFGPLGMLLGPLFVTLFVALLRLYDRSYRPPAPPGRPQLFTP